jgi:hypothetical protein
VGTKLLQRITLLYFDNSKMDSRQIQNFQLFDGSLASNRLGNLPYEDKMRNRIEAYHSFLTMYIQYHKTEHQDTTPITILSLPLHCLITLMSYEMDVPNAVTFHIFEIQLSRIKARVII